MIEQLKQLSNLSKNLHVLYVEDDVDLVKTTQAMFTNIFQEVEVATNGEEALEKYIRYSLDNNRYFDIVVTDIKMPKMNGLALSKKLKEINKQQLIVVTSAYDDSKNLIEFINIGIKKFIKKPFTLQSIVATFLDIVNELQTQNKQKIVAIVEGFCWNIYEKRLMKDDIEVKLTQNEILILDIFFNNKWQIFSNDDLYYVLIENNFEKDLSTDSIKAILKRIRKKLPENLIENIYGQGYRINKDKIINFK